jgi:hypothetical protein
MKRLQLLAISGAVAALACAAPAASVFAQAVNPDAAAMDSNAVVGDHGNWTLKERENWLGDRLRVARNDGSIDDSEFDRVRHELDRIRDSENDMRGAHDGGQLTDNETATLETRLDGVADQIHWLHENSFERPW